VTDTGCPKKTWEFSDELDIVFVMNYIVIPDFTSHNSIMSARVYFIKKVKVCKDVSINIMSPQDEHCRLTSLLCLCTSIFLFY